MVLYVSGVFLLPRRGNKQIESIRNDIAVAVAEAVRGKEEEIAVVTQNLIVKEQTICTNKIATAELEVTKLSNRYNKMKDCNLATTTTSKQELSKLKQKHQSEVDKLTSKHTSQLEKLEHQHILELYRRQNEYDTKIASVRKELQQEKSQNKRDLLSIRRNSNKITELREVKRQILRLETQLEKNQKLHEEEQCKLNEDLVDAKDK